MEAFDFCQGNGLEYIEVSALTGMKVNEIFEDLSKVLVNKEIEKDSRNGTVNTSKIRLESSLVNSASRIEEEEDETWNRTVIENKGNRGKCC